MGQCWLSARLFFDVSTRDAMLVYPRRRFRNSPREAGKRSETVGERFKHVQEWCGGRLKRLRNPGGLENAWKRSGRRKLEMVWDSRKTLRNGLGEAGRRSETLS